MNFKNLNTDFLANLAKKKIAKSKLSRGERLKELTDTAKPFAMLAAATAIGGTALKDNVINPLAGKASIMKSKHDMMKLTPSLRDEDEKIVKNYFNVVKTFSPKAASNPLVAGALVNKMIQFGGVDHKLVQDLAKMQKDSGTRGDNLSSAMTSIHGLV
jgi:hypothetical protein